MQSPDRMVKGIALPNLINRMIVREANQLLNDIRVLVLDHQSLSVRAPQPIPRLQRLKLPLDCREIGVRW